MRDNFAPFHLEHGLLLLFSIIFVFVFLRLARSLSASQEKYIRILFCTTIWGQEIVLYFFRYTQGSLSLSEHLPFHMCSLSVWMIPIMLFIRKRGIISLLYFWGMGGATQALLTPTVTAQTDPFLFFQFFISHTLIIVGVLYPIFVYAIHPSGKDLRNSILYTILLLPCIGLVNWMVKGNYFYLAHKPNAETLLDVLGPWPIYIVPLVGIGGIMFTLLYLPFWIISFKAVSEKK